MNPKITVCMCTYNRAQLMLRSIKCIIDQTFKDFEFLIINDGSTDNTEEILEQLSKQDSRIRYITNKHDFISSRTLAFKEAKGDYIALIDSDDLCMPNKLEEQYNYLESHKDTDVVSCQIRFPNGQFLRLTMENLNKEDIDKYIRETDISQMCHFPTIMFRRKCLDIFKDNIFYPEFIDGGEDQAFMYSLYINGYKFANINTTMYLYNFMLFDDAISATVGKHFSDTYCFRNLQGKDYNTRIKLITELYNKYNKGND